MKKLSITLLLSVFVIAGCQITFDNTNENENEQTPNQTDVTNEPEELKDLKLHILAVDEEAGATVENSDFYSDIQGLIDEDPKVGIPNDFTIRINDVITTKDGESMLLMLAINRVGSPLKDISFELTIGNKNGENVRENELIILDEEDLGILETDSAVPVLLPLSEDEVELLDTLVGSDLEVIIDNFEADPIE